MPISVGSVWRGADARGERRARDVHAGVPRPDEGASARGIARALGENALLAFPPEAFEQEVVVRSFFGRRRVILSRPESIHHILVDNPGNYRRTSATIRMLRPLLGKGSRKSRRLGRPRCSA